jgi:hypothetical protein
MVLIQALGPNTQCGLACQSQTLKPAYAKGQIIPQKVL